MGTPGPFGAESVPARAGTERCGPRQRAPLPPLWAPNFVLRPGLAPSGDRGNFGVGGCLRSCVYPDHEEEGAVTFSDCGQGTTAASLGGSGDVRRGLEGEAAPRDALCRPTRSWRALSCVLNVSKAVQPDGRGDERRRESGEDCWGGPSPSLASARKKADGEVRFSRLPLGPPSS